MQAVEMSLTVVVVLVLVALAFDFMNGFHGFPTRGGATLLWTGNLGQPVTYGCILISTDNAIALYGWAQDGVVVEIRN